MTATMKDIKNVTVVGSGTMGKGIAMLFAMNDYDVTIYTRSMAAYGKSQEQLDDILANLSESGFIKDGDQSAIKGRITFSDDFEKCGKSADIVIENIVEDVEIKKEYFRRLDAICPKETILASNTSVISITELCEKVEHKERVIGTHFWNPPYLIPLVEVIKTVYISDDIFNRTCALMERVGKKPVAVEKDVPGFVGNRMQHALFREALSIVENGIASADDVDNAIKYGFGMRLGISAPIEVMDRGGMDLTHSIHEYLFPHIENTTEPQRILTDNIEAGKLGFKTGEGIKKWTEKEMKEANDRLSKKLVEVGKVLGYYDL